MAKIKKLNWFDKPKLKTLTSFLDANNENLTESFSPDILPFCLHYYLPLRYKFYPESYLLTDNREILGLITTNVYRGNPEKINISRLMFWENSYETAQQLSEFVIAQYGAMGARTFYILIDEYNSELAQLLVNNCGFRQCSTEQLWEIPKRAFKKNRNVSCRRFKKSDIKEASEIYNDSVLSYFKPALNRNEKEFTEPLCSGLRPQSEYRYVIEIEQLSKIQAYFKISTSDNECFTVDFNYSEGYDIDFDTIMYFASREILKRKRQFKLLIKMKNYIRTNKNQTDYLCGHGFKCVNTKLLLVKDFFKIIKEPEKNFVVLDAGYNGSSF